MDYISQQIFGFIQTQSFFDVLVDHILGHTKAKWSRLVVKFCKSASFAN